MSRRAEISWRGLHHFFASPDRFGVERVTLTGEEAHHAARVLRVRMGERITVADGAGRVAVAEVCAVRFEEVEAAVLETRSAVRRQPRLLLYQALAKGDRTEVALQKAVELGAERVVTFASAHSNVREVRIDRLRAIAFSAAKQCRSPWITEVDFVFDRPAPDVDVLLVLHEAATVRLRDALPTSPPAAAGIVVGPEGGLTGAELESFGGTAVTLGDRVLRTETAGAVALALVSYAYGLIG